MLGWWVSLFGFVTRSYILNNSVPLFLFPSYLNKKYFFSPIDQRVMSILFCCPDNMLSWSYFFLPVNIFTSAFPSCCFSMFFSIRALNNLNLLHLLLILSPFLFHNEKKYSFFWLEGAPCWNHDEVVGSSHITIREKGF